MNIYSKYCSRKTRLWLASMLLSFTAVLIVMIIARKLKFDYYPNWIYKGNFRNPEVFLEAKGYYFRKEVSRLILYLPFAFAIDVYLRKLFMTRVNKPQ